MPRFHTLLQYTTEGSKGIDEKKVTVQETFARKAIQKTHPVEKFRSIYFTASGEYHIATATAEYPDAARQQLIVFCFDGVYWGGVQVKSH